MNLLKNRQGTALLVALLVMAVLMAVSLALSALIFRETRITREFIDSGQAYYAAESAIELGLYGLNNNLPGWEAGGEGVGNGFSVGDVAGEAAIGTAGYQRVKVDDGLKTAAELKVKNRCQAYPCFDEDFDKDTAEPKEFYAVLGLNESVTIPLFVVDGGEVKNISDFAVEFYAPFDPNTDLNIKPGSWSLSGWDVLRWKIIGITNAATGGAFTESISDFTAVSMNNVGGEDFPANAANPSWFGTADCDGSGIQGRYNDEIKCQPYSRNGKFVDPEEFGQISKIYAGICSQAEAREYYQYSYVGDTRQADPRECYPIKSFITSHSMNYLTLTNLINPAVFVNGKNEALAKLYYRVELFTDGGASGVGGGLKAAQTVREYADLTANGYSGKSKKSINVRIKKDSFMPVFNFSLYSTYISGKKDAQGNIHDEEYWYGEQDKQKL